MIIIGIFFRSFFKKTRKTLDTRTPRVYIRITGKVKLI